MEIIRCGSCNKKLAEAEYTRLSIKCPRCGAINQVKAASREPERHGASVRKGTLHGSNETTAPPAL
ncbi:Com family DNA-binding transcriptional regulator [Azospira sp. APE16]|uniref:Com family DNA-binding transcriptional regulator n=1 Tax=Azospira sp. APE16 TaxID=3394231 RepID=UPI003A4D2BC4